MATGGFGLRFGLGGLGSQRKPTASGGGGGGTTGQPMGLLLVLTYPS